MRPQHLPLGGGERGEKKEKEDARGGGGGGGGLKANIYTEFSLMHLKA